MATYGVPEEKLTAIADAIRLKTDSAEPISVDDMPLQIVLISGDSKPKTVTVNARPTIAGWHDIMREAFGRPLHVGDRLIRKLDEQDLSVSQYEILEVIIVSPSYMAVIHRYGDVNCNCGGGDFQSTSLPGWLKVVPATFFLYDGTGEEIPD